MTTHINALPPRYDLVNKNTGEHTVITHRDDINPAVYPNMIIYATYNMPHIISEVVGDTLSDDHITTLEAHRLLWDEIPTITWRAYCTWVDANLANSWTGMVADMDDFWNSYCGTWYNFDHFIRRSLSNPARPEINLPDNMQTDDFTWDDFISDQRLKFICFEDHCHVPHAGGQDLEDYPHGGLTHYNGVHIFYYPHF